MSSRFMLATLAATLVVQTPAAAQSLNQRPGDISSRATVGITIPLDASKSEESKPRLELRVSQTRFEPDYSSRDRDTFQAPTERRIGFTLDANPTLMLNGKAMKQYGSRSNLSTIGYVLIGVAVVGVGAYAVHIIDRSKCCE